jgi:hypothetical protein
VDRIAPSSPPIKGDTRLLCQKNQRKKGSFAKIKTAGRLFYSETEHFLSLYTRPNTGPSSPAALRTYA